MLLGSCLYRRVTLRGEGSKKHLFSCNCGFPPPFCLNNDVFFSQIRVVISFYPTTVLFLHFEHFENQTDIFVSLYGFLFHPDTNILGVCTQMPFGRHSGNNKVIPDAVKQITLTCLNIFGI